MSDLKVVPINQNHYSDPVAALKDIVRQLESGEIAPCITGCLMMRDDFGIVQTFGFGPKSDELQCIGLIQLGQQVIVDCALGD